MCHVCNEPMCQSAKSMQLLIFRCQCANKCGNVPKACQLFNLLCQHANVSKYTNFSTWHAKRCVEILTSTAKRCINFSTIFKRIFQFLNFLIMLNICKFQEYLGNSFRQYFEQYLKAMSTKNLWHCFQWNMWD